MTTRSSIEVTRASVGAMPLVSPLSSKKIRYRQLRQYKYELAEDYTFQTSFCCPAETIETPFLHLGTDGVLTVRRGYAWDGASGPTIDTKSSMRGSLLHDAFYQLMREGRLNKSWRGYADAVLRDECIADGMYVWRANWWYRIVQAASAFAAAPSDTPEENEIIIEAP